MAEHLRDAQKNIETAIKELGKDGSMAGHIEGLSKTNEYLDSVLKYIGGEWERNEPIKLSQNKFVYEIASRFAESEIETGEEFSPLSARMFGGVYAKEYGEESPRKHYQRGLKAASTNWHKILFDCGLAERKMLDQRKATYRFGEQDIGYIKLIKDIPDEELRNIIDSERQIKLAKRKLEELGQDSSMLNVSNITETILEKRKEAVKAQV